MLIRRIELQGFSNPYNNTTVHIMVGTQSNKIIGLIYNYVVTISLLK